MLHRKSRCAPRSLEFLIRDARLAARRSPDECARAMGVTKGMLRAYEEGRRAPSLPELESLAYFLNLPMEHFWGKAAVSDEAAQPETPDLPQLVQLRQRMIGALLRQERTNSRSLHQDPVGRDGHPGGAHQSL